jgi:hypothetical protein
LNLRFVKQATNNQTGGQLAPNYTNQQPIWRLPAADYSPEATLEWLGLCPNDSQAVGHCCFAKRASDKSSRRLGLAMEPGKPYTPNQIPLCFEPLKPDKTILFCKAAISCFIQKPYLILFNFVIFFESNYLIISHLFIFYLFKKINN